MNRIHGNYSWKSKSVPGSHVCNRPAACHVENRPSSNIAKVDSKGNSVERESVESYTYMDEEYLRCLQLNMGWNRDNGIIELMPSAVVYQENGDVF